ncbi:MAG TPA: FAD-binding oxidoreductase [Pseudonocardiaceae bacterium]|nr:FAD-binding oxidoreductase [Pseudonocardiaceae bacterium]
MTATSAAQLDWADDRLREQAETRLAPRLRGPLFLPGDAGYDGERSGYNQRIDRRPAILVGAAGPADVMAAVAFATDHGLPVGVSNTGHGALPMDEPFLMINTRRMTGIRIDPFRRSAWVEAGVTWADVVHEAAAVGLAPLSGSAPGVGAVGYLLGGGLGLLGRTFGYGADHLRSLDVVTAHGMPRQAGPGQFDDLFWAVRGAKDNFGVVTSAEFDLFPVPRLYGGGLYFRGRDAPEVLHAYRRWVRTVPDGMNSSVALLRFPHDEAVPAELRGRFTVCIRIAYHGATADAEELVRPLRKIAVSVADTTAEMPYQATGAIHSDPVEPFPLCDHNSLLRELDEDAVDALIDVAGPDTSCPLRIVELRHLGGALSRPPEMPNAVGHRGAEFLLYTAGVASTAEPAQAAVVDDYSSLVLERLAGWSTGGVSLNFLGATQSTPDLIRSAYEPADFRRLTEVKRAYDPENLFRVNHNIPPAILPGL